MKLKKQKLLKVYLKLYAEYEALLQEVDSHPIHELTPLEDREYLDSWRCLIEDHITVLNELVADLDDVQGTGQPEVAEDTLLHGVEKVDAYCQTCNKDAKWCACGGAGPDAK